MSKRLPTFAGLKETNTYGFDGCVCVRLSTDLAGCCCRNVPCCASDNLHILLQGLGIAIQYLPPSCKFTLRIDSFATMLTHASATACLRRCWPKLGPSSTCHEAAVLKAAFGDLKSLTKLTCQAAASIKAKGLNGHVLHAYRKLLYHRQQCRFQRSSRGLKPFQKIVHTSAACSQSYAYELQTLLHRGWARASNSRTMLHLEICWICNFTSMQSCAPKLLTKLTKKPQLNVPSTTLIEHGLFYTSHSLQIRCRSSALRRLF